MGWFEDIAKYISGIAKGSVSPEEEVPNSYQKAVNDQKERTDNHQTADGTKTWAEMFGQSYTTPDQPEIQSGQQWQDYYGVPEEGLVIPSAAEVSSTIAEQIPDENMFTGVAPGEVVPEEWDPNEYGLYPSVKKEQGYKARNEMEASLGNFVKDLSPETQAAIAQYYGDSLYATPEEVMDASGIFSLPGTTPEFDKETGIRSNAMTEDSYYNRYIPEMLKLKNEYDKYRIIPGDGYNWANAYSPGLYEDVVPEDPSTLKGVNAAKLNELNAALNQAKTEKQAEALKKEIADLEKNTNDMLENYDPYSNYPTGRPSTVVTQEEAEKKLREYLTGEAASNYMEDNPSTGVTPLITDPDASRNAVKAAAARGEATDYSDPAGDLNNAAAARATGDFELGSVPLQGKLAQAFYDKVHGNPEAADYYTNVQTEIFDNYAGIWEETYGYPLPFSNLLDFMFNASLDDAWEFAQFAHSIFGMYSTKEAADGNLDYGLFADFYNECKAVNQIDKLIGADGRLVNDVVDVWGNDVNLAELTTQWLYENGYTSQKIDAATLFAMAAAQMPDMGSDFYEANYRMLGDPTNVGTYVEGGPYSAQERLPWQVWNYYNPDNPSALESALASDNEIQLEDPLQAYDSVVFSKGYGWDQGPSTPRSNIYEPAKEDEKGK